MDNELQASLQTHLSLEKAGQRPHKEKEEKRKYKNSFMGNKDEVA